MAKDVAAGISAGGAAGKQAAADNAQDRLDAADARLDRLKTRREDVPGSKKATYDAALKTAAERIAEARRLITKASDTDLHELSKSNSALAQAIIGSEQALDQAAGCIQE